MERREEKRERKKVGAAFAFSPEFFTFFPPLLLSSPLFSLHKPGSSAPRLLLLLFFPHHRVIVVFTAVTVRRRKREKERNKNRNMTFPAPPSKKIPADAAAALASEKLIPLLADSVGSSSARGPSLVVEFPSVPGDKERIDERGNRVYEEAIFHGGFDRGDRLPLVEVASRLGPPGYSVRGGVGGERGSAGSSPSSVFSIACVDPDAPGGVGGSSANAPFLHHLVVDAPGPAAARGRELCEWMPPSPPKGLHR